MKDKYIKPETDIKTFNSIEVITTSSGSDIRDDDNVVEWGW